MSTKFYLSLFLQIIFTFQSVESATPVDKCGQISRAFTKFDYSPEEHRVVGGNETEPNAWPWTVGIVFKGRHHCGGALLKPDIVITAAHCFALSRRAAGFKVYSGSHAVFSGTVHEVNEIQLHPFYHVGFATSFDAALLRISPPANMSDPRIGLVCLPLAPPITDQMCVVTGWGRLSENGRKALFLREIHVPVLPTGTCNNFHHYGGRINAFSMFCAGYSSGSIDSCQGDSGGPLVCQSKDVDGKDVWLLQGIVSWGIGCAKPGYPGVYTKVFSLRSWITTFLWQHGY